MRAKLGEIKEELRRRMHEPIPEQGRWLKQVVTGFFAYHAVPTNSRALSAFRHYVIDRWRRTLRRRSQKDGMTWERMTRLADAWLPNPRILHPWPEQRFPVNHPRWEPNARIGHARFCAGGARQRASLPRSSTPSGPSRSPKADAQTWLSTPPSSQLAHETMHGTLLPPASVLTGQLRCSLRPRVSSPAGCSFTSDSQCVRPNKPHPHPLPRGKPT